MNFPLRRIVGVEWGWDEHADEFGAKWYWMKNGTQWSRGPDNGEWWSPGSCHDIPPWIMGDRGGAHARAQSMAAIRPQLRETYRAGETLQRTAFDPGFTYRVLGVTRSYIDVPQAPSPKAPAQPRPAAGPSSSSSSNDAPARVHIEAEVPPAERAPWTLRYFETYGARTGFTVQHKPEAKKMFSHALKFLRCEGVEIQFPDHQPLMVGRIDMAPKGPGYEVSVGGREEPLHWREMIALIDNCKIREDRQNTDMEFVVGPGITSCWFKNFPKLYDHKMYQHIDQKAKQKMRDEGEFFTIWDFVVYRTDGSAIALHPQNKSIEIHYRQVLAPGGNDIRAAQELSCPRAGPGNSDGKGTFKRHKQQPYDGKVFFDLRAIG